MKKVLMLLQPSKCIAILYLQSLTICSVFCDVSDIDRLFFNQKTSDGGYIYPAPPVPPVQLDEPSPLPPMYLPPIFADEEPFVPPSNYLPPTPPIGYLPPNNEIIPPTISNDDTVVISAQPPPVGVLYPPNQGLLPSSFRIENMSCAHGMNFRATFKMSIDPSRIPVVDDATEGCITSIGGNMFRIDLDNFNSMLNCGVRRCRSYATRSKREKISQSAENMCVVVRIPTVRGVRLPEDGMITLMCVPQERVVSETRHVKLGSNKIQQISRARANNGFVATGGTQKDLKTRIGIFRKRPGSSVFDQNVQSDSIIQLGEELVLRAVVNGQDGWKSSQIGPVLITGLNSKKSALLVDQQGCVNPAMKSICPRQPHKVHHLSTELHFRAFLFQESPQGDEMIVSVRTQGCLNLQDCIRTESCTDDSSTRVKRELTEIGNNSSKISLVKGIKDFESQLSFKVEPMQKRKTAPNPSSSSHEYHGFLYISLLGVFLSVLVIILLIWQNFYRKRSF